MRTETAAHSRSGHHQHHPTTLSPSLQEDLRKLRRASPLLLVFVFIGLVFWLAYYGAGLLIGPQERWKQPIGTASRFGLSPSKVTFQSPDGIRLTAWWERPWTVIDPKGTLILLHGSQMNKTGMAFTAGRLLPRGYNVLVPDLRAHGESSGEYSTFGYKEALDVLASIRWVREHGHREPIILLGYSSGAVAALHAAARSPEVSGVIADSAYASITSVLEREADFLSHPAPNVVVGWTHRLRLWLFTAPGMAGLSHWMFRLRSGVPLEPQEADTVAAVRKITRARVLYMASAADPVVPMEVTRELYNATAVRDKQLVVTKGAFHSALAGEPRRYIDMIAAFLDKGSAAPAQ